MTDREIIKALVNVIEPKTVTEEALKQIIIGLLDSHPEEPRKVDTKVKAEPKAAPKEARQKTHRLAKGRGVQKSRMVHSEDRG